MFNGIMAEKPRNSAEIENKTPYNDVIKTRAKEAIFLTSVAGMSVLFGFGLAIGMAKKKDPNMFTKGLIGGQGVPESGAGLALKALGWGTLYSITGVGALCYGFWKLMGVSDMKELTAKVQSVMPTVPKNPNPGKSDFKTVEELVDYIVNDGKGKGS